GGGGLRLRLAAPAAPQAEVLAALARDLGVAAPGIVFDDPARGVLRRVALNDSRPAAFLLAGDLRAHEALMAWADGGPEPASLMALLMGRVAAPARARTVCVCAGVSDQAILAGAAA